MRYLSETRSKFVVLGWFLPVLTLAGLNSSAVAQTEVCGGLFADTSWTAQESPYLLTCDVRVFLDWTLTIEPGVVVQFDPGTELQIDGTLVALGTDAEHIAFISVDPEDKGTGVYLETNEGGTGVFDYADFSSLQTAIRVSCCYGAEEPAAISNCVFFDNDIGLGGHAGNDVIVTDSLFEYNTSAIANADKIVYTSEFRYNLYGLNSTERISVYDSVFEFNDIGLRGGNGVVEGCTISANGTGVESLFSGGFDLMKNTITGNDVGVIFINVGSTVECNDIFANTTYNAIVEASTNGSALYNWWGTVDIDEISAGIYDGVDDTSVGLLLFEPFLSSSGDVAPECAPACVDDLDCDGVPDDADNCPDDPNPDQADFDGDSTGDVCDSDIDNDGVLNDDDVCDYTPLGASVRTDGTFLTDADGDCDVDLLDFAKLQEEFTGPL